MNQTTKIKMTKENFEDILQMWKDNVNRNVAAVYHASNINYNELTNTAFNMNITIKIKTHEGTPFATVDFGNVLLDITIKKRLDLTVPSYEITKN